MLYSKISGGNRRVQALRLPLLLISFALALAPARTKVATSGNVLAVGRMDTCPSSTSQNAQKNVSSSPVFEAPRTGRDCKSNACRDDGGCATCVKLVVEVPPETKVVAVHCFTNAHYPEDFPKAELHEVTCTEDNAWSIFESPIVREASGLVTTVFHNRSSDRDRVVRLDVEWR